MFSLLLLMLVVTGLLVSINPSLCVGVVDLEHVCFFSIKSLRIVLFVCLMMYCWFQAFQLLN